MKHKLSHQQLPPLGFFSQKPLQEGPPTTWHNPNALHSNPGLQVPQLPPQPSLPHSIESQAVNTQVPPLHSEPQSQITPSLPG
jgi:hypothetical protein